MAVPLRVLVVEDSEDDALLLVRELKRGGYEPDATRVETPERMEELLASDAWDAVVADYALPKFSAPAALELVQRGGYDLPFIIVSGKIGEETAVAAMRAGAHDYIMKDNLARLVPAIQREIKEAEERQSRRVAQAALRQSEERYRLVVENANEAIVIIQDGQHRFFNARALAIAGYDREEYASVPLIETVHAEDREKVELFVARERAPGSRPQLFEFRIVDTSGTIRWVQMNAVTIDWESRPALLAFLSDITDRKELEASLRQSTKMEAFGQLAGGIAHDFNNLLTGILGYASMLKLEVPEDSTIYDSVATIEKTAQRAADLTRQLLGFARKEKYQFLPVDLHETIHEVVFLLSRTIDKSISITQRLHASDATIHSDPGQLHQVLLNLAINARDAMPEGGELTFETERGYLDEVYCRTHYDATVGDYLMVGLTDTGSGIPEEIRTRIFEPFFTTKEQGKGTGMGLAMVYSIVRNHGGHIQLYSEHGHGTTFKLYFPVKDAGRTDDLGEQSRIVRGSGRILVVDDEEVVRNVAIEMLGRLGYEVTAVPDGQACIDFYQEHGDTVDLVIIDMIMPEMEGRECFRELKTLDPDVRAVLSTGFGYNERARAIIDEGMLGFVEKPYQIVALGEKLHRVLNG